jgi:hypothetical protein
MQVKGKEGGQRRVGISGKVRQKKKGKSEIEQKRKREKGRQEEQ